MTSVQRVVVVGQGYVGLPLAMAAVTAGFDVVGFDLDVDRTKNLADGTSFTSVVVIVIVDVFESRAPSFALNVKLSLPLKSGSG